jgi:peptidoglycan/LPS O-acetylase OafA/YrhL
MKEMFQKRIFGLDILRTIAIMLVVLEHSKFLIHTNFGYSAIPLLDGVDLFFVLSGYLIGLIILKLINRNSEFKFHVVLSFLRRRWFRTLPNYFLFLILNIILIYFGLIKGELNKYLITFFVFFQNFYVPFDFLFWESWSLSVEEWFYFLFPVVLFFGLKIKSFKQQKTFLVLILTFLIVPLLIRIFQFNENLDYDLFFRKLVITRLDTIGFGILAAYIKFYYKKFWINNRNKLFVMGLSIIIFLMTYDFNNIFFKQTLYFSIISVALMLILPKLESFKKERIPFKPFFFFSKISYSMYLVHIPLMQILSNSYNPSSGFHSLLLYVSFWILTIGLSYLIYVFYEKPLTDLRDKQITLFNFKRRLIEPKLDI